MSLSQALLYQVNWSTTLLLTNEITEHGIREHLLVTDELLYTQRSFIGVGLSELLKTAKIPKGSFYHYSRSKEAFGVTMSERHHAACHRRLATHSNMGTGNYHDRILAYYQETLDQLSQHDITSGCLTIKLSAEACSLSENMRTAIDKGVRHIIVLLVQALERGQANYCLSFVGKPLQQTQILYALWLSANLQAKISRNATPLENVLAHVKNITTTSAV